MIARIWKGATPLGKADLYYQFLLQHGIKDCRSTGGNQGVFVFRRDCGEVAEFLLLSLWDSIDAIRGFAGARPELPKYYPGEREFLIACEDLVWQFELLTVLR